MLVCFCLWNHYRGYPLLASSLLWEETATKTLNFFLFFFFPLVISCFHLTTDTDCRREPLPAVQLPSIRVDGGALRRQLGAGMVRYLLYLRSSGIQTLHCPRFVEPPHHISKRVPSRFEEENIWQVGFVDSMSLNVHGMPTQVNSKMLERWYAQRDVQLHEMVLRVCCFGISNHSYILVISRSCPKSFSCTVWKHQSKSVIHYSVLLLTSLDKLQVIIYKEETNSNI